MATKLFKGVISNCQGQVLTNVSGSGGGSISTGFTGNVSGGMSMKIGTTHSHYTTFDIGNITFKCKGEYPFRDGDKVVFYARQTEQIYYEVEALKNFTRNFFIEKKLFPGVKMLIMCEVLVIWCILYFFIVEGIEELIVSGIIFIVILATIPLPLGIIFTLLVIIANRVYAKRNQEIKNYPEF